MDTIYDLVIIGGGPAGLALAQCCSKINKKILIIEKQKVIGGCHAVRRVNDLFTEHGPRVYSNTYKVFQSLLNEIGVDFYDLFTEYKFSISEIGGETIFSTLSVSELTKLTFEFLKLVLNDNHGRNTVLRDYLINSSFTDKSLEIIDRICKLTDGGGSDKFTLNEFLQLFNQQFFYSLYQPKLPNDIGLFKIWKKFLETRGVQFYLDSTIKNINITRDNFIESIVISRDNSIQTIKGKEIVMAAPPINLYEFTKTFNIKHNWGDLQLYSKNTAYIDYISVTFHWDTKVLLKKVYGFPKSAWGLAFIVLSDYMTFNEMTSKTVISAAVTISDTISYNNKKTANQCNPNELVDEMFLQLKEAFGEDLPIPSLSIISPGVFYDKDSKKWVSEDVSFITTSMYPYLPFKNDIVKNFYNLGTHNGKSLYKFTSLESAVSNAVYLSNELYPELKESNIKIIKSTSLSDILTLIILVIISYLIYYSIIRRNA